MRLAIVISSSPRASDTLHITLYQASPKTSAVRCAGLAYALTDTISMTISAQAWSTVRHILSANHVFSKDAGVRAAKYSSRQLRRLARSTDCAKTPFTSARIVQLNMAVATSVIEICTTPSSVRFRR